MRGARMRPRYQHHHRRPDSVQSMGGWSGWVRVTTKRACFALVVRDGVVVECAPYARRASLGRPIADAAAYWRSKGATVVPLP